MACTLRSLASSAIRRHVTSRSTSYLGGCGGRSFGSVSSVQSLSSSTRRESLVKAVGAGMLLAGSAKFGVADQLPFFAAKCQVKVEDETSASASTSTAGVDENIEKQSEAAATDAAAPPAADLRSRAEALYSDGRLGDVYELLNENPETKNDAKLLFRLAQTTHKMSLTTPMPERKRILNDEALLIVMKAAEEAGKATDNKIDRADVLALYGTVIQHRAHRKLGAEKKQLFSLAEEHMTAALREDAFNFHANHALADLNYELAQERTELGRQSLIGMAIWDKTNNNKLSETDQESLWRASARHAYVALKSKPNDLNSINHMAQAKFAIGDLPAARTYTLRALAAEKDAKFVDEKQAAKDSKDLMEKINAILGEIK